MIMIKILIKKILNIIAKFYLNLKINIRNKEI